MQLTRRPGWALVGPMRPVRRVSGLRVLQGERGRAQIEITMCDEPVCRPHAANALPAHKTRSPGPVTTPLRLLHRRAGLPGAGWRADDRGAAAVRASTLAAPPPARAAASLYANPGSPC